MTFIQSIILGVVEGASEFLPISSTAHLILTTKLLNISQNEFTTLFEVVIQTGAILSILFLYAAYIKRDPSIIAKIGISFIPTAIIGFLMHDIIKTYFFQSNQLIATTLGIGGLVFIVVEILISRKLISVSKDVGQIRHQDAIIIGIAQSTAILPGVSRAGAVIIAMLCMGYTRRDAALYSFLLAVPTILAASAYDLLKTDPAIFTQSNILLLLLGSVVAFISAFIVTKWFVQFLQNHSLIIFGGYRIALALVTLLFLL